MATASLPVADSASAMMSMLPADFGTDLAAANTADGGESADVGVETVDAEPAAETIEEPPAIGDTDGPEDQPVTEEEVPDTDTETEVEPPKAADTQPTEELPEGVRAIKDTKGKDVVLATKERWENAIYPAYKFVQQAAETIGEPLTMEALQLREQGYQAQERLLNSITSGDPQEASGVVNWMLDQMAQARQNGEVGSDPAIPMAQAFYQSLQEKSPDAYANIRFSAARDLIRETFAHASQTNNQALFNSAQFMVAMLAGVSPDAIKQPNGPEALRAAAERMGLPFHMTQEMPNLARGTNDPMAQIREENARLRAQLDGRGAESQKESLKQLAFAIDNTIYEGQMKEAIEPALAAVAEGWKPYPKDYERLVLEPLKREVGKIIDADKVFAERVRVLGQQAKRATSQQVREARIADIRQAYVNRTSRAVEAAKRPILDFAANWLKSNSKATHERRTAAQSRTAPSGTPISVPRSLTGNDLGTKDFMSGGVYDTKKAAAALAKLMPR